MPSRSAAPGGPTSLDELRRRVYAPDATDVDRERYRVALGTEAPVVVEPTERSDGAPPPDAATGRRAGGPRRRLVLAAVVVLAVAVIGGLLLRQGAAPQVAAPTPLKVGEADRSAFVDNLRAGGAAGIAAYLLTHGSTKALSTAVPLQVIERSGSGSRTLPLDPSDATAGAGRITVILVLDQGADAGWTAYRLGRGSDGTPHLDPSARRGGEQAAGVPTTAAVPYGAGGRPVQLRIQAPSGVRWGVEVEYDR